VIELTNQARCQQKKRTYVAEAGSHDDSFIPVLFVIVVNFFHRLDTRVVVALVILPGILLVPIKDLDKMVNLERDGSKWWWAHSANEGRDEGNTSLGASNGLAKTEKESEVTMNAFILFELAGSLDTLPR
jgi:hypothetical protein